MSSSKPTVREIFDEHARYIWRTLHHLGIPESDVADVCQEVFLTVHRRLHSFEGRSSVRTWLYGICIRRASEHRRRPYVRNERPASEPPPSDDQPSRATPESQLAQRTTVERLLGALDDEKRRVVVLYEIEGFSMREVAEILNCPVQTAYSRLHTGRELMLKASLNDASDAEQS